MTIPYNVSDEDISLFAELLRDYAESYVADGYGIGLKASAEMGQDAIGEAEDVFAEEVARDMVKILNGILLL